MVMFAFKYTFIVSILFFLQLLNLLFLRFHSHNSRLSVSALLSPTAFTIFTARRYEMFRSWKISSDKRAARSLCNSRASRAICAVFSANKWM